MTTIVHISANNTFNFNELCRNSLTYTIQSNESINFHLANEVKRKAELEEQEKLSIQLAMQLQNEERIARQKELDNKRYFCIICDDDFKIDDIYTIDGCCQRLCRNCMTDYIKSKIGENEVVSIKCPFESCKHDISYQEIKVILNKDAKEFEKYDRFLLNKTIDLIPGTSHCPKNGCSGVIIVESGKFVRCPVCSFTYCLGCKEPWHDDFTCEQYQQWKKENGQADTLFIEWKKLHTKTCPKCKVAIEKNQGCNHMTCKNCKHEFCWLCSKTYSSSHFGPGKCSQFS